MQPYKVEVIDVETGCEVRAVLDDGRVIGKAVIADMPGCSAAAILCGLVVDRDYQRKGVAKAIAERARVLAKEQGISVVLATVREDNLASRAMCQNAGLVARECFASKHGGNVLLYTMELKRN